MPFTIPEDLHPDLMPLVWLIGHWEGRGQGDYPNIDAFEFGQDIQFSQNGKPFLYYLSQTYTIGEDGTKEAPISMETGFWRPQPDNKVEVLLTHDSGVAEVWDGQVDGAKIELHTDVVARTTTAQEVTAGHRLYGLVDGDLMWAYDKAAEGHELQPHLWGTLKRL